MLYINNERGQIISNQWKVGKCNCTRTKLFLSLSAEGAPSTTAEARVCTAVAALPDQLRGEGLKGAPHTAI